MPWEEAAQGAKAGAPPAPWEEAKTASAQKTEEPGFLDKNIPLSGPWYNPTLSGVQSIARGTVGALRGVGQTIAHPIEAAKSLAEFPSQVAQVPAAVHDINASPDPLGTYAKVGQETAGQGAGQALVGLGTEGLVRGAPLAARIAKPVAAKVLTTASDIVDPELTGVFSPRLAHAQRFAGRIGRALAKGGEDQGPLPETDLTGENKPYAGAPKPRAEVLDATKENKPFAGGMDEAAESSGAAPTETQTKIARPETAQATPRGITPPEETPDVNEIPREEWETSRFIEPQIEGTPLAEKGEPETSNIAPPETSKVSARGIRTPAAAASEPGSIESRLSSILNNIRAEDAAKAATPGPEEDLTPILQKSLAQVNARKGIGRANNVTMEAKSTPGELINRGIRTPAAAASEPGSIESRLSSILNNIRAEDAAKAATPGPEEDLTPILQQSLADVEERKGIVRASAAPKDLLNRWGVDEQSFAEGRAQTRGMKPDESADAIKNLTARYKSGKPVDPVVEIRDADNNLVEVDGRGRALAAQKAGVERIPVIVRRARTIAAPPQ